MWSLDILFLALSHLGRVRVFRNHCEHDNSKTNVQNFIKLSRSLDISIKIIPMFKQPCVIILVWMSGQELSNFEHFFMKCEFSHRRSMNFSFFKYNFDIFPSTLVPIYRQLFSNWLINAFYYFICKEMNFRPLQGILYAKLQILKFSILR